VQAHYFPGPIVKSTYLGTAQEGFVSSFEFELPFALFAPETTDRVNVFTVNSGVDPQRADVAATDDGERITLALSIASPNERFGETIGRGSGPFHGPGFELLISDLIDVPELDNTDRTPLKLSADRAFSAGDPRQHIDPDDLDGDEINNLSNAQDS
jgi:hypothetical protein